MVPSHPRGEEGDHRANVARCSGFGTEAPVPSKAGTKLFEQRKGRSHRAGRFSRREEKRRKILILTGIGSTT